MRIISLALCLIVAVCSCSKKEVTGDNITADLTGKGTMIEDTLPAVDYPNVNYGPSEQQRMDVYLPIARNENTKIIIIIHGGGWTAGDKTDFNGYVTEFQRSLPEYAIVNLNYRLVKYDSSYFPMQEEDMISAIEFLKSKASEYHISQQFILLGSSAGAHLALLQGYKHADVTQPLGIVSFFGPTDLSDLFIHYNDKTIPWVLQKILGGALQEDPEAFQAASPINYVSAASAPTLLLHGDQDPLVPINQAYMLRDKLTALHVANQLVVYPGKGHGWSGADLNDSFSKIENFIKGL